MIHFVHNTPAQASFHDSITSRWKEFTESTELQDAKEQG